VNAKTRVEVRRGLTRLAVGAGVAAAGAAGTLLASRAAAHRHRSRQDPEAHEPFGLLPPEDLGPVTSFDGTPLAVRAAGPKDAPAIVFSHGITLDMTTWYYQWQAFSDRYRCILFDHRAHGRSGKPPEGDYSVQALGRDLDAVLEAAAPEGPVLLAGHSMGGMAIVSLAEQRPELFRDRVAGVTLVDTAVSDLIREFFGVTGASVERVIRPLVTRITAEGAERFRGRLRRWGGDLPYLVALATNFGPDASPAQVEYITQISSGASVEVWTQMLRSLIEMDLRDALEHVACPALVVVGDRDLVTPKTSAMALREALPNARAVAITGAGHISMMERHAVFNEVFGGFVEEALPLPAKKRKRA
jgi:pimeloyl-ACP methyl ester carboxylesterase